jgi:hypothetical protein
MKGSGSVQIITDPEGQTRFLRAFIRNIGMYRYLATKHKRKKSQQNTINLHVTYEGLGQKRSSDRTPLGGDLNRKEG